MPSVSFVPSTTGAVATPYRQPLPATDAVFFGHYSPSRARVQLLLDYASAHDRDDFWSKLAARLADPQAASPWNEAVAVARETGRGWDVDSRERRVVYGVLYEGRIPGRRRPGAPPFDREPRP